MIFPHQIRKIKEQNCHRLDYPPDRTQRIIDDGLIPVLIGILAMAWVMVAGLVIVGLFG